MTLSGSLPLRLSATGNLTGVGVLAGAAPLKLNLVYGLALEVPAANVVPGPSANGYEFYPQPIGVFPIAIGVSEPYAFDWTDYLVIRRPVGALATLGMVIRAELAQGFQFVCTTAGETSSVPPLWPNLAGQTVYDGSAIWTCEDVDDTSLLSTVASALWSAPPGISATFGAISSTLTPVLVTTSAASAGTDYPVTATVTFANGTQLVGTLLFQVPQPLM